MSLDEAFLQDICEHPDDDVPRLVYADWLEERGDPRSEFIRLQIEMHRLEQESPTAASQRYKQVRHRVRQLLAKHRQKWLGPLLDVLASDSGTWRFRRGFLDEIHVPIDMFLAHGEMIAEHRTLRVLALWDRSWDRSRPRIPYSSLQLLAAFSPLACVTSLSLSDRPDGDDVLILLARSLYLTRLRDLGLMGNGIGPAGARVLATEAHLPQVDELLVPAC